MIIDDVLQDILAAHPWLPKHALNGLRRMLLVEEMRLVTEQGVSRKQALLMARTLLVDWLSVRPEDRAQLAGVVGGSDAVIALYQSLALLAGAYRQGYVWSVFIRRGYAPGITPQLLSPDEPLAGAGAQPAAADALDTSFLADGLEDLAEPDEASDEAPSSEEAPSPDEAPAAARPCWALKDDGTACGGEATTKRMRLQLATPGQDIVPTVSAWLCLAHHRVARLRGVALNPLHVATRGDGRYLSKR